MRAQASSESESGNPPCRQALTARVDTDLARERMSSLALNIVPDDRVSIVAGPFAGNPITSMSVCWSMPGKGGEDGDAKSNTLSDIDGAVVVGHANGACNIYSNNASIIADEQELVRPSVEGSDEILPAIKWKKQRAQPRVVPARLDRSLEPAQAAQAPALDAHQGSPDYGSTTTATCS